MIPYKSITRKDIDQDSFEKYVINEDYRLPDFMGGGLFPKDSEFYGHKGIVEEYDKNNQLINNYEVIIKNADVYGDDQALEFDPQTGVVSGKYFNIPTNVVSKASEKLDTNTQEIIDNLQDQIDKTETFFEKETYGFKNYHLVIFGLIVILAVKTIK
tara:strand:+ start:1002 stop:1472 length:471 start_codon:yes stop_codon:yes gene_type:complete